MKTLKLSLLAAVAAIVVACGGGNPLVQSWKISALTVDGKPFADAMREAAMARMPNDSTLTDSVKQAMMAAMEAELKATQERMMANTWTFNEDMTVTMVEGTETKKGKWNLSEDKKKLTITPDGGGNAMDFEVVALEAGQLKLKQTMEGSVMEFTMMPSAAADLVNAVSGAMDSAAAH
jgi:hypothetical protein